MDEGMIIFFFNSWKYIIMIKPIYSALCEIMAKEKNPSQL